MIALVGLVGVVEVMTVSPPQVIVSPQTVDNAFTSPAQVAADTQGATIAWLEGVTATKACVKAARLDTSGRPQPAVELACAPMPSNMLPLGGPAIGAGGGKSLVAWTRDGGLVGQLLSPSLASTPAFKVKLPDESPRAIGWDGSQYWILTASSVSMTCRRPARLASHRR
jgi:hypothetical protein